MFLGGEKGGFTIFYLTRYLMIYYENLNISENQF